MMSDDAAVAVLVNTIIEMAEQQTNPVLAVIGNGAEPFREQQKYPQPPLNFQQGPWRAYYHCHSVPDSELSEHGHFHIFTNYEGQWVHVVALSMDNEGQAQDWLTVNRWVTDGPWVSAALLNQHLSSVNYSVHGLSLCERWLLAMLQVFNMEINELLEDRDRIVQQYTMDNVATEIQDNREIYTLAISKIDLLTKLKKFQSL